MISLSSEIESYFDRLWPIMRSITGDGVRKTHDILSEITPLNRYEVPSGSKVFYYFCRELIQRGLFMKVF